MKRSVTLVVAVATFYFAISPTPAESFGSGFKPNENPIDYIHSRFNRSADLKHNKWLVKATIPTYLREFVHFSPVANGATSDLFQNETVRQFFEELFDGVTNDGCKVHVTEWLWRLRVDNLENISTEKDKWVLQMADAWGKLPEGILSGHVNAYGDFDECLQANVNDLEILNDIYSGSGIPRSFDGLYCTSYILDYNTALQATLEPVSNNNAVQQKITQNNDIQKAVSLNDFLSIMFGITPSFLPLIPSVAACMPNSCSQPDVQKILVNGFHLMYNYSKIPEANYTSLPWPVTVSCTDSSKPPLDTGAIITIVLLAIMVALAFIASIIDYWYENYGFQEDTPSSAGNKPPSTPYKYLMAFSCNTNIKKWLSTRKNPDDLGCLHGIRFLTTSWVVLGHSFGFFVSGPQWNLIDINDIHKYWSAMTIMNATFAVDTFFVMGGLLVAYNLLKVFDKSGGRLNIIMFYLHRYLRLTPTYAILIAVSTTLMNYAGNGPQWYTLKTLEDFCRQNWWTNLLYVSNVVNAADMCNGESWYLSNDMQFYVLAPFILYPIWKWEVMGYILLSIYTVLSCIAPVLAVRYGTDVPPVMVLSVMGGYGTGLREVYVRPWSRISPFLVGVWLGVLLHKTRGKRVNLSRPITLALWACSTGTALAVLFGILSWFNPANDIPKIGGYFYVGLSRFAWGMAIAWVIFACVKGYGGIVNKFLSWKVFMPLGRLCFCVYLTSLHLQNIFYCRLKIPIQFDRYTIVNLFFGHLVMSFSVGFVCTLLFESPFITFQKLIFEGKAKGGKVKPTSRKNSFGLENNKC